MSVNGKRMYFDGGNILVQMKCEDSDIEAVKMLVSGYNVISGVVEDLLNKMSHISSVIAHSNQLKANEIEEMKIEHREMVNTMNRPLENDLIEMNGIEHRVARRKFKNGKMTYVLHDNDLNYSEIEE